MKRGWTALWQKERAGEGGREARVDEASLRHWPEMIMTKGRRMKKRKKRRGRDGWTDGGREGGRRKKKERNARRVQKRPRFWLSASSWARFR